MKVYLVCYVCYNGCGCGYGANELVIEGFCSSELEAEKIFYQSDISEELYIKEVDTDTLKNSADIIFEIENEPYNKEQYDRAIRRRQLILERQAQLLLEKEKVIQQKYIDFYNNAICLID